MRQCGGKVREHVLTKDRVAWTCGDCGRYEVRSPQGINKGERDGKQRVYKAVERVMGR